MPIVDPVELFKEHPEELGEFQRALSTLHRVGVLEVLRERGRVSAVSESSPNYVAAQASRASFSQGYNRALDELIYFQKIFVAETAANTMPPLHFGSLERAVEAGDLTLEESNAIRSGGPIPTLKREPIPATVHHISEAGSKPRRPDAAPGPRGNK